LRKKRGKRPRSIKEVQCDRVRHDLAHEAHNLVSRNSGKPALVDVFIDCVV